MHKWVNDFVWRTNRPAGHLLNIIKFKVCHIFYVAKFSQNIGVPNAVVHKLYNTLVLALLTVPIVWQFCVDGRKAGGNWQWYSKIQTNGKYIIFGSKFDREILPRSTHSSAYCFFSLPARLLLLISWLLAVRISGLSASSCSGSADTGSPCNFSNPMANIALVLREIEIKGGRGA